MADGFSQSVHLCHWGHIIYLTDPLQVSKEIRSKQTTAERVNEINSRDCIAFVKHNIVWMGCIIYIYKIQMQTFGPPNIFWVKIIYLFVCSLVRSSISATYTQMFLSCYGYFAEKISCSEGRLCALKVEIGKNK